MKVPLTPLALAALVIVFAYMYVPSKPKKETYCAACGIK
jgi:hypothetical protein